MSHHSESSLRSTIRGERIKSGVLVPLMVVGSLGSMTSLALCIGFVVELKGDHDVVMLLGLGVFGLLGAVGGILLLVWSIMRLDKSQATSAQLKLQVEDIVQKKQAQAGSMSLSGSGGEMTLDDDHAASSLTLVEHESHTKNG